MIETNNPEIDVNELMERVRSEAAKVPPPPNKPSDLRGRVRRAILPAVPEIAPLPRLALSAAIESMKEGMTDLLRKAQRMTEVSPGSRKCCADFFESRVGSIAPSSKR